MSLAIVSAALAGRLRRDRAPALSAVARFAPECRAAITRTCAQDPRLTDLAVSFPALLHRIAMRRDEAAAAAVIDGVRLADAAARAGLPLWTRRLPPEAFGAFAPDLPDGAGLRRRLPNCLPRTRRAARGWLDRVAVAARWGEEDFIVWVARETARSQAALDVGALPLMALHAFYSRRPETFGGALRAQPWSLQLKPKEALRRARTWLAAAQLAVSFGGREIDPWCEPGVVDGFEFVPILNVDALLDEARALDNCLAHYGGGIAGDFERIWSIRRDGVRVAALCIEFRDAPFPLICELKGPRNELAPGEVWFAARKWLDGQPVVAKPSPDWNRPFDQRAWVNLWKPYWLARSGSMGDLPLSPSRAGFETLYRPRCRRRRRRHG